MAEPLSAERGSNQPDRGSFLDFVERHEAIDDEKADAAETMRSINRRRKDLRKLIAAEGHNIDEFDRALVDSKRSGEEREAADKAYRRNMAWLGKPVGFQAGLDLLAREASDLIVDMSERDLKKAEKQGFDYGKRGDRADSNSYTPGTEAFARFHSGWMRGQALAVEEGIQPTDAPRRRGRPPGAQNKPKANGADVAPQNTEAYQTGRQDGAAGHMDHAARYPAGEGGHADYHLGHAAGQGERHAANDLAGHTSDDGHADALDERLHALALRLDCMSPKAAISIVGAAEALAASEDDIEASLARLTAAGKLQRGSNGIWYPPAP